MPWSTMRLARRLGARYFFAVVLQLLGQPMLAAAANCPPNSCCKDDTAQGAPAACVGNPINLVSGNKYQMEVDMPALPGVLGLELVRHYNSESSRVLPAGVPGTSGAAGKARNANISVLGRGWRLSYDRHIAWQGDGSASGDLMTLTEGDGRQLLFIRSLRHALVFEGRGDALGQVIRVRPAAERARLPAHVGWRFEWQARGGVGGGLREHFDAKGWMVARMAPTGEVLTIRRNTVGWPLEVTDPQGRQMTLHYMPNQERADNRKLPDSQHRFSGVQRIDTPVGRFDFQYGGPGPVGTRVPAAELVANLRAVGQPGNITRRYHHEDPRWPTLLTGISVETASALPTSAIAPLKTQRIVTWLYDSQGRAVLSVHGHPARLQRDAKGQPLRPARLVAGTGIDQVFMSWPRPNEVEMINALGQRTTYRLATIADQLRVVESRGPGCPSCTPGNTRWRYDNQGRVLEQTQLTPQGQPLVGMRWQYDDSGRVVAEQAVRYNPAQGTNAGQAAEHIKELAQYIHAFRRDGDHLGRPVLSSVAPQIISRPSVVPGKRQETHISYNDRGQPLQVTHKGWRPAIEPGQAPQLIERNTRYSYTLVNNRSVLTQVDGPLPNGPTNSPQDSDITRYTWDGRGSYLVGMETPQGKSQMTYDAAGRVASVSSERGTTRWTYNGQQLTAMAQEQTGWPSRQQSFAHDAQGRLTDVATQQGEDPAIAQLKQAHDSAGRLLWQASAMGVLETNQWDALGQLTQTKRLTNAITQENNYAYDEQGRITQLSDNQGRITRIAYNELGQPALIADQTGRVMDLSDAAMARAQAARKTSGTATSTTADAPAHATRPQQWVDDFGRVVATRSPDHGLRTQQYDEANRLVAMQDALGSRAQYQYDARGRIVKQTVESDVQKGAEASTPVQTTWRYEGDHLVALTHPTQSEHYSYDERGFRTSKTITRKTTDGGDLIAITRYAHNEQGQLMGSSLPDGSWITYTRNGQGQVVAIKRSPIHPQHLRWLAWLVPEHTIAQDFERDMIGVRSYSQGNGLQTRYQRSQAGVLARVHVSKPVELKTKEEQAKAADRLLQLLGIQAAMAQQAKGKDSSAATDTLASLGAMGSKPNAQAILDHRYLWDTRGNLLLTRSGAKQDQTQTYAYDGANRLLMSVASEGRPHALKEKAVNRYFYQGSKRVLQQQGARSQQDIQTHTLHVNHSEGTHQWTGARAVAGTTQDEAANYAGQDAAYDEAGQPTHLGQRRFKWDAYGRLVQVSSEASQATASHTYNHRGERIRKEVGKGNTSTTTDYLHDDHRQLQAELNAQGRITRQYIYLANLPLAVIDTPDGALLEEPHSGISAPLHELAQVITAWFAPDNEITYLHTNHLGAVEAATNTQGQVIWQASYEPFGKAHLQTRGTTLAKAFTLNLRLPGQYEDAETSLYYNDHRYYDPERGEYISPDPLGHPDGANPYAYVASNPLNTIDPLGLILFAFDGTGNTTDANELQALGNGISNVWLFRQLYNDGNRRYVSGVGTVHHDEEYGDITPEQYADGTLLDIFTTDVMADMGGNYSGPARIDRMLRYFDDEAELALDDTVAMNVDIVGFSRGASQARDFANRIVANTVNGIYRYTARVNGKNVCRSQAVNFRFMGLFDTVLSTNRSDHSYNLGIPDEFTYVAHAVALNEYREKTLRKLPDSTGAFPLESIMLGMFSTPLGSGKTRIERGFIGAHADIGGGFASENDLAKVALSWMVEQAKSVGVNMRPDPSNTIISNPVIHDKSDNQYCTAGPGCAKPYGEDRQVNYGNRTSTTQRNMVLDKAMSREEMSKIISYLPPEWDADGNLIRIPRSDNVTGTVNMQEYMKWLQKNNYDVGNLKVQ